MKESLEHPSTIFFPENVHDKLAIKSVATAGGNSW